MSSLLQTRHSSPKNRHSPQNQCRRKAGNYSLHTIEFFVPKFKVESYEQLFNIRKHHGFESERALLDKDTFDSMNQEKVRAIRLDVMEMKESVSGCIKRLEWILDPLTLLPVIGGLLKK